MRNVFIFHWSWCAFSFPLILVFEFFWALASVFVFMCTGPVKTLFHLLSVFVFMCTGPFKVLFHLLSVIVFMCAGPVKTLFHLLSWNDDTHYKSGNFLQPLLVPNTDQS